MDPTADKDRRPVPAEQALEGLATWSELLHPLGPASEHEMNWLTELFEAVARISCRVEYELAQDAPDARDVDATTPIATLYDIRNVEQSYTAVVRRNFEGTAHRRFGIETNARGERITDFLFAVVKDVRHFDNPALDYYVSVEIDSEAGAARRGIFVLRRADGSMYRCDLFTHEVKFLGPSAQPPDLAHASFSLAGADPKTVSLIRLLDKRDFLFIQPVMTRLVQYAEAAYPPGSGPFGAR